MTVPSSPAGELSPIKRALLEIRELRTRVDELQGAARTPIAIVGMSVRAPGGVHDAASFAELLWSGRDAIGPIPSDRWSTAQWYDADPDAPARMTTRHGGFIDGVDRFDAEFFGISPREAASMDPQQRLLLELAWQALEDAGHAPASLAGSRTGVYVGVANGDYGRGLFGRTELIDPYFSTGNSYSVASGRLSYVLGLQGPAVSLDTACSSSLVAIHLACQALRNRECDIAIAGGVNLILSPEMNISFSKAGMMAKDGRCKTFDASADGYVRGEGGALLVLRRLPDASADGDRVLALIRGSAIGQDGRSNGLTAPNGPAQEAVVRDALAAAGVLPADVDYVETHGTGTPLGDPIEVNALGAVLCAGRPADRPLAIGSVKTNIGHLEAAAGVVGLVKTVLALNRAEIPPHLHFQTPNPFIEWDAWPIVVPTRPMPWSGSGGRRIAGVSSFGFSGTNAHVVLESASPPAAAGSAAPRRLLALSARDDAALAELVAQYRGCLVDEAVPLDDLCFTADAGRSHFAHRLAVQGESAVQIDAALAAAERGDPHGSVVRGVAPAEPVRIAFLFPGQGPQYADMGRALYDGAPVFRQAFDACCAALDPLLPRPLRDVIFSAAGTAGLLDETAYAQPAMFAIEIALASLWRSWGVEPVAVLGHSFGEYAAACIAGAMSIADAAQMVAARARLVQALPGDGRMAVIEASEAAVAEAIVPHAGRVAIAAVNGDANTVISGHRGVVDAIVDRFAAQGARTKSLRVSHAFHSPLIDSVLDAFEREIEGTVFASPRVALISNLSGGLADRELIGHAGYWRRHLRETVRFADSVRALAAQGITHYVEMSPHPVLLSMGSQCVEGGEWLASLREGRDAWTTMLESVQTLYCGGATIDWNTFHARAGRRRVALPTYPFQRRRHWIDRAEGAAVTDGGARWQHMLDAMDRQSQRGPLDLNAPSYPAKWAALDALTTGHALQTLHDADLFVRAGERHDVDSVMRAAGIAPTYRHLLRRWLQGLADRGHLQRDGETFVAERALPAAGLPTLWRDAERLFADNRPLFDYVRHCGTLVADVLRGRESPLETLFPGGSFDLAQGLYERSTAMRYVNQLAGAAFEVLGSSTPAGRCLRVLEIGAGTGGTSSSLLPLLPPERRRYRFTDVSDAFLERARARFAAEPGVEFGLFDLDAEPGTQGVAPGSVDVVVSANAVHAVRDLRSALSRLHTVLAPGGLLVLVESTVHLSYFDMTTGLIEGWQHFDDDLRTDNPLLPPDVWVQALKDAGFVDARAWPEAGSPAEALGQHVIVARMQGDAPPGGGAVDSVTADGRGRTAASAAAPPQDRGAWLEELSSGLPSERRDHLTERVRAEVMRILRLDPASPPSRHDRMMDLGMDSLMAVQLRNALGRALALERPLPSTLMFDHPTIDAVALYLESRLWPSNGDAPPAAPAAPAAAPAATPLAADAVIAMSDDDIARLLDERLGSP